MDRIWRSPQDFWIWWVGQRFLTVSGTDLTPIRLHLRATPRKRSHSDIGFIPIISINTLPRLKGSQAENRSSCRRDIMRKMTTSRHGRRTIQPLEGCQKRFVCFLVPRCLSLKFAQPFSGDVVTGGRQRRNGVVHPLGAPFQFICVWNGSTIFCIFFLP